jgi:hypothetical protein
LAAIPTASQLACGAYISTAPRLRERPEGGAQRHGAITIASDFDGSDADGTAYRKKFAGKYSHQILTDIGHDVAQEALEASAKAVVEVDSY